MHCAHTACAVVRTLLAQCPCRGRCCTHSKLVARMLRAQPMQVARSACAGRVHSAQVVGACRDLSPLPIPRPGRDILSRSRPPRQLSQVATLIPCRDLPFAQPNRPGRDLKMGSRHQFQQARLRPQIDVATSLCSAHGNAPVATQTLVATLNHHKAARTMSRHQFDVATPRPVPPPTTPKQVVRITRSRLPSLVATSCPTKPGRDLITMSRPQEVLTHNEFFFFLISSNTLPCYS